jgi:hypothetical protein
LTTGRSDLLSKGESNFRLEVNSMHALHRPRLPRAMMVTFLAAILAIVLTLALATRLNDLTSTSTPTGQAGEPPALQAPAASPGWKLSPFKPLLSARVALPWAPPQP